MTTASAVLDRDVSRLSAYESAATVAEVLVPLLARGVIARRPAVVGLLERVAADRRAVARLQVIRARHGGGPAVLRIPGRQVALVLSPSALAASSCSERPWMPIRSIAATVS